VAWLAEAPVDYDTSLYNGKWRSVFGLLGWMVSPIPGISVTPFQVLAVVALAVCLATAARRRHSKEMIRAIQVSLLAIVVTLAWGLLNGGGVYFAYYQLWHFLFALLFAYVAMSAVGNERDIIRLGKLVIFTGVVRATLCNYYYLAYLAGTYDPKREYVTNHDDSMLFVMAIQVLFLWAVVKGGRAAWIRAAVFSCWIMYAIVLNNRRLAWMELLIMAPALYVLIGPGPLRSKVNKWVAIMAVPLLAYFVIGMNSSSAIFAPVHALATTGSVKDASSLAREEEIRNLLRTLGDMGNPLFGTGWGRPYEFVERAYNNYSADWILAPYTPHNSLVGLGAFSGLLGIIGIWGVVPLGAFLAARGFKSAGQNAVIRVASLAAIGALVVYGVHSYGDIGLQSLPGSVMLGIALGIAGRVAVWNSSNPSPGMLATAAATSRNGRPATRNAALVPTTAKWNRQ
jgi:hypothetical protein